MILKYYTRIVDVILPRKNNKKHLTVWESRHILGGSNKTGEVPMQNYESESLEVLKKRGFSKEEAIKIVEKDQSIRKSNRSVFFMDGFKVNILGVHVAQLFEMKHGYKTVVDAVESVTYAEGKFVVELKNGLEGAVSNQVELFDFLFEPNSSIFKDAYFRITSRNGLLNGVNSFTVVLRQKDKTTEQLNIVIKDNVIKLQDRRKNIKPENVKDTFSSGAELKEYLNKTKAS